MGEAVIVSATRSAIGTAFKGTLADVDAFELGTQAVAEAVKRSGVDPELFDDVLLGESLYGGGDIARYAALEAGLDHVPGAAHNRHCASGLTTVAVGLITDPEQAEAIVASGQADAVALARAMLYDPRWPWHAAAALGTHISVAPQYLRCEPHEARGLFDVARCD